MKTQKSKFTKAEKAEAAKAARPTEVLMDSVAVRRFQKDKAKALELATLPAMRPGTVAGSAPKKARKARGRKAPSPELQTMLELNPRLANYFKSLSSPWETPVKCPVNFNPVPSYLTSVARLTGSMTIQVGAGITTQLDFFPGHGPAGDEMDGVAYHTHPQAIGATGVFIMGPLSDGTRTACAGISTAGLGANSAATVSNTVNSVALPWAQQLPFTAADGDPGHTRTKCVSFGVELENITKLTDRSGLVQYVQPSSEFAASQRSNHEVFETYTETEKANTGTLKITWIPRPADLSFWHTSSALTFSSMLGAGLRIWLDASAATGTQTYRLFYVYNFELAGSSLESIATKSLIQPADQNIVSTTLGTLRTSSFNADSAPQIARAVAHSSSPFAVPEQVSAGLMKGLSGAVKTSVGALLGV